MKKFFFILLFFCCLAPVFGQILPPPARRQVAELPAPAPFKPKLSLQNALKIMEKFVAEKQIDTARYYLSGARMIQFGADAGKKEPVWFFEWNNDRMITGDYLHILVSMDGRVWQMPTM